MNRPHILQLSQRIYRIIRTRIGNNLLTIEKFIEKKLAEGFQVDLSLASFVPRLSSALSARDADQETDGLCVQGTVTGRAKLRNAIKDKVEAVTPLALIGLVCPRFDTISGPKT